MIDHKMIQTEARLFATPLAQKIAARANVSEAPATFGGTCASLILQMTLVSLALMDHEPGSPAGEAWLRETYAAIIKDAVERWHKSDLKERRAQGKI